jgi:hypothetical protein
MLAAVQPGIANWASGAAGRSCEGWQTFSRVARCMRTEAARTKALPLAPHRSELASSMPLSYSVQFAG